jgi:DNA-binding response OmpR family regulator
MEGIDGLTVMREVKKRWPETMVIIMTAYASIDSAIEAVRQGAFDYLRKPCSVEDIIKCANRAITEKNKLDQQRQLVRQAKTNLSTEAGPLPVSVPTVCTGDLVIDTGSHTVSLAGNSVPITPTEYGILAILVRSLGQPVSMEQLIKQGLEYNPQNPQAQETLRVHISRLRRKIGSKYILTIRGGSYALANIPTE